MRPIIEAHLVDAEGSAARIQLATIDRVSTTDPIGMSLGEGKALLVVFTILTVLFAASASRLVATSTT